jgi:hypothetical protein
VEASPTIRATNPARSTILSFPASQPQRYPRRCPKQAALNHSERGAPDSRQRFLQGCCHRACIGCLLTGQRPFQPRPAQPIRRLPKFQVPRFPSFCQFAARSLPLVQSTEQLFRLGSQDQPDILLLCVVDGGAEIIVGANNDPRDEQFADRIASPDHPNGVAVGRDGKENMPLLRPPGELPSLHCVRRTNFRTAM